MAQRAEQKARTRQAIFDAARDVFLTQGADAPIEAIAERAGVSKPTVFFHYQSRLGLQVAVAAAEFERMTTAMNAVAGPGTVAYLEEALRHNGAGEARLLWLLGDALAWAAPGSTEVSVAQLEEEFRRRLRHDGVPEGDLDAMTALVTSGYLLTARRMALGGAPAGHERRFLAGVQLLLDRVTDRELVR